MQFLVELTPRQREVAMLIARGDSQKQVGAALNLTPGTVKEHLQSVYLKLGLSGSGAARELRLRAKEFGLA